MAVAMAKRFMDICVWTQTMMSFPVMNEVAPEMIGGKPAVLAN